MFWHIKMPITGGKATMERSLSMEVVRVTEAAAIASGKWMGRGLKIEADDAATTAMRKCSIQFQCMLQ